MTIWEYILLFLSVLIGGGLALKVKKNQPEALRLLLSFSGAYILGIAALHLMPAVFRDGNSRTGLWLLLGFFVQILLEQLSRGVEHGHIHAHQKGTAGFGFQILLGLCLHSFIEGMPLSSHDHIHENTGELTRNINHLLYGIVLHKVPAAFALVILLLQSHFDRKFIVASLFVFASMSPLGAFLAEKIAFSEAMVDNILAFVVGSFLHISTTILFEADITHQHRISIRKLLAIIAGFGISLLTLI